MEEPARPKPKNRLRLDLQLSDELIKWLIGLAATVVSATVIHHQL
jgi:hypothetical protein